MSDHRDIHTPHDELRHSSVGARATGVEPPWFDDRDDHARLTRRRWLVIAAAVVPWTVVLALLVVRGGDDPDLVTEVPAPLSGSQQPLPLDHAPTISGEHLTVHQLQGNWRSSPGPDAAGAVAIMIARSWITGAAPQLDVIGRPETHTAKYAEHLTVEAVEQVDQAFAVVTVLASVIDGDWQVAVRRVAVPVWTGSSSIRPAGQPWWLPELTLDTSPLEGEVIEEPELLLAAAEAIGDAGYQDVELIQLERTTAWPWRATVRAATPAGEQITTPVLLRRHVDRFVVAGTIVGGDQPNVESANVGIGRFLP